MTTHHKTDSSYRALGIAAGLAAIWAIAAIARPNATFHLAPILIVLAPLVTTAGERPGGLPVAVGAALIALGTSLALAVTDLMRGPSLLPFGGALTEAVVFAAVGASIALAVGVLIKRRGA